MSPIKNVLIILADQHHAGLLGCAGNRQVFTPHLDRFAASGTRFANAYAQNPICTPSRVSILSGQYCHNHGYYGLSGPSNERLPNLMRHFKAAGYRTAAFGKLHLPNSPKNWLADDLEELSDAYETIDGFHGHSEYLDSLERLGLRELEDSWHNDSGVYGPERISLDAGVSRLPYENTVEVWSAQKAMSFIDQDTSRPFCIQVAFQKPHHPLLPQKRFWDLYPKNIELPPTFSLLPSHRPPHFQKKWKFFQDQKWTYGKEGESFESTCRRIWRGTLACVSQIDDIFGTLMNYLDRKGIADSTLVVYGSDHGGYHGIHGLMEKAPGICSDAVCRVPFIWRAPGLIQEGRTCDALVENVDIPTTIASLCGLPPYLSGDGIDLSPLLRGEQSSIRNVAVTENVWSKSIRFGTWRAVYYQPGTFSEKCEGELYDMETDPMERKNLFTDPAHHSVVEEGRKLLLEWIIKTTRITTAHAAIGEGSDLYGKKTYPIESDGRAPSNIQPRVTSYHEDYL